MKAQKSLPMRLYTRVDPVSIRRGPSVGVYGWAGDLNRNERWLSRVPRFKEGEAELPALLDRILAEHVRATLTCRARLGEVDYVVPVPAAGARTAERGSDLLDEVVLLVDHIVVSPTETVGMAARGLIRHRWRIGSPGLPMASGHPPETALGCESGDEVLDDAGTFAHASASGFPSWSPTGRWSDGRARHRSALRGPVTSRRRR